MARQSQDSYHENKLPEKVLARCPDSVPKDGRVNGGKERTVQPTATLRNELGNLMAMRILEDFLSHLRWWARP